MPALGEEDHAGVRERLSKATLSAYPLRGGRDSSMGISKLASEAPQRMDIEISVATDIPGCRDDLSCDRPRRYTRNVRHSQPPPDRRSDHRMGWRRRLRRGDHSLTDQGDEVTQQTVRARMGEEPSPVPSSSPIIRRFSQESQWSSQAGNSSRLFSTKSAPAKASSSDVAGPVATMIPKACPVLAARTSATWSPT